jgi:hypothetical protein
MADFGELQKKFDNDPDLCKRFLSDPVGVLAENDVVLAPQHAFKLQQDVMNFTRRNVATPEFGIHITAPHISISIGGGINITISGGIDIR